MRRALLLVCVVACTDDPAPCPSPFVSLRDPEALTCASRKLPTPACPEIGPLPPWPACGHPCEDIRDAATCAAQAGCRIAWVDCLTFPDQCDHPQGFVGCYGLVTLEPVDGPCDQLPDAFTCAAREDCAGVYVKGPTCPGGDPHQRIPDGEACRFTYASCTDELSPPT